MRVEAVIFDLDGVLIDTKSFHYEVFNRALGEYGFGVSEDFHSQRLEGLPTAAKLQILHEEQGLPLELFDRIAQAKSRHTQAHLETSVKEDPLKTELLGTIAEMGLRQVVCSNTTEETVAFTLRKMNLDGFLEFFLTKADIKKAKPDPEIYHTAIRRLAVPRERVIIFEDSDYGVSAATASGARVRRVTVEDVVPSIILPMVRSL